jgi:hypothetical protein
MIAEIPAARAAGKKKGVRAMVLRIDGSLT